MILRVGLTGGIASGKSTAARLFRDRGCIVIDADAVIRDLYRPGEPGYRALVATWGDRVLDSNGEVDRRALSRIALSTPEGAAYLNSLTHPLVIERQNRLMIEISARHSDRSTIVIVEATLLIESGGKSRYDRIVVVDLDPSVQLQRAVDRGMSADEVERRRSRQMDRWARVAMADYVIRNDGGLAELEAEVERVQERLKEDLRALREGTFK